ncbi:hypothetical protein S83_012008 [Arachis hypogaea]
MNRKLDKFYFKKGILLPLFVFVSFEAWVNKFSLLSHVCLVNADAGHAVSNAAPTAPSTSIMRGCLTILVKSSILLDIKVRETDVPLDHDAKVVSETKWQS